MEGIYEWIRNITFYLIFMTVVENLLPNKKYEKYFRLFAGMILILLVLKPFTGGLRLDDKLAYYFEAISFKKEASELTAELSEMEGKRLENMVSQYEEAVNTDLASMAESSGFRCRKAEAVIEADEASESFGHVVSVYLLVRSEDSSDENGGNPGNGTGAEPGVGAENGTGAENSSNVEAVREVKPIKVELEPEVSSDPSAGRRQEDNSKLSGLRRKISEYYDLEEQDIEIQLENG